MAREERMHMIKRNGKSKLEQKLLILASWIMSLKWMLLLLLAVLYFHRDTEQPQEKDFIEQIKTPVFLEAVLAIEI